MSINKTAYIPSVIEIHKNAFYECAKFVEVSINSVGKIESSAFTGCVLLRKVEIGNSLSSVGCIAFAGCSSLVEFNFLDSLEFIWFYAFYGCFGITHVNIPDSIENIEEGAFYGCFSITDLKIPQRINKTYIGIKDREKIYPAYIDFAKKMTSKKQHNDYYDFDEEEYNEEKPDYDKRYHESDEENYDKRFREFDEEEQEEHEEIQISDKDKSFYDLINNEFDYYHKKNKYLYDYNDDSDAI